MAKKKKNVASQTFVLDSSVTLAWFFDDEADPYADSVQDALVDHQVIVPSLWPLEIANMLIVGERRKRTTEAKVTAFVSELRTLPIRIDDQTVNQAWGSTLSLARLHNLSAYDAAYLELVQRLGLSLATLDANLKVAAKASGIPLFVP